MFAPNAPIQQEILKKISDINTRSPATLKQRCFEFYLQRYKAFIQFYERTEINTFDLFPDLLKNDFLNYLSEKPNQLVDDRKSFHILIHMLLNHRTSALTVRQWDTHYTWKLSGEDHLKVMLKKAADLCPNLERFVLSGRYLPDVRNLGDYEIILSYPYLEDLIKLKNLRVLDLDNGIWWWRNENLAVFQSLRNLVVLKLPLHSEYVNETGLQNIQLLENLEKFYFLVGNPFLKTNPARYETFGKRFSKQYQLVYSWCAQNMPNLKMIGGDFIACALGDYFHGLTALKSISPQFEGTSQLEYLHSKSTLPDADFTNLQYLNFTGPAVHGSPVLQKMLSFTRLTGLSLCKIRSKKAARQILEGLGKQLSHLGVNFDTVDFYELFWLCPNLTWFQHYTKSGNEWHFAGVDYYADCEVVQDSMYQKLVSEHNVRLLKEFQGVFCNRPAPVGFVAFILQAPLLEFVTFNDLALRATDCDQVLQAGGEGYFQRLEDIRFRDVFVSSITSSHIVAALIQLIQHIAAHAPRLWMLTVYFDDLIRRRRDYEWENNQVAQEILSFIRKRGPPPNHRVEVGNFICYD